MPTNLRLPVPSRQRATTDDLVVAELAPIATSAGATPASIEMERLRDNTRRAINRCLPTLVRLLRSNGRARDFAAALVMLLDPHPVDVTLKQALLAETAAESIANPIQADVLAGDESGPAIWALHQRVRAHREALEIAEAALAREVRQRMGIAA